MVLGADAGCSTDIHPRRLVLPPVEAVGFHGIDVGDTGGALILSVAAPGASITRIELRNASDSGDGFGYDDLIVGQLRRLAG